MRRVASVYSEIVLVFMGSKRTRTNLSKATNTGPILLKTVRIGHANGSIRVTGTGRSQDLKKTAERRISVSNGFSRTTRFDWRSSFVLANVRVRWCMACGC